MLDVRARRTEACVAVLSVIAGAGAPWLLSPLAPPLAPGLSIAAVALVILGLRRAGWLGGSRRLVRVVWQSDDRWFLTDASGSVSEGRLRACSRIASQAAWLCWHADVNRSMLLTPYDIPPKDLRRLVVRLRLTSASPASRQAVA